MLPPLLGDSRSALDLPNVSATAPPAPFGAPTRDENGHREEADEESPAVDPLGHRILPPKEVLDDRHRRLAHDDPPPRLAPGPPVSCLERIRPDHRRSAGPTAAPRRRSNGGRLCSQVCRGLHRGGTVSNMPAPPARWELPVMLPASVSSRGQDAHGCVCEATDRETTDPT